MSLSVTLSSALSGLQSNSRAAEIVSNNVANALTDGYGRREIELSARSLGGSGGGVRVTGVLRVSDGVLLSDRRAAEANTAGAEVAAAYHARLEAVIGTPEDAGSLGKRLEAFDSALLAATSRPDSEARLAGVLTAAKQLTGHLADASDAVQQERARADDRIADDVTLLNATLAQVADMNARILKQVAADRDASALMDQRQQLVDRLAGIVPITEIQRSNGQISLVTTGGAILLDGRPAIFGFRPAGVVTADMTIASGALSGLTLNSRPLSIGDGHGKMEGGTLSANFTLRDHDAPEVQRRLDGAARDLITRFADQTVDPTLAIGAAGLFTDDGAPFDLATEPGLAGRLSVNALVEPERGGALWRLRDGLGATVQGPPGGAAQLSALHSAFMQRSEPASGGFAPGERSFQGLASDILSQISSARIAAEARQSFAGAKYDGLRSDELSLGVDSDQEVQQLLLIEQAYSANAQVIKAVDQMIQIWLGM
jgi:flagellar hook-associated protein 1